MAVIRLALAIEPRFRGGTSTAVVRQLAELAGIADISVVGIKSRMFGDSPANPVLLAELDRHGLSLEWASGRLVADVIVFHNPLFLKFQADLNIQLVCRKLIVVTHENFLLPGGNEAFDVAKCLLVIERAAICSSKVLAPVSDRNRRNVQSWIEKYDADWILAAQNWINICDGEITAPTASPSDRRGRHSRPELEKFPGYVDLITMFPETAEYCGILGADNLIGADVPNNWDLIPFNGKPVAQFLSDIDFFVYFTNPYWGESFGYALAEAVGAGKLVITDHANAQTFGLGVIGTTPSEVGACVEQHILDPRRYGDRVRQAQAGLLSFSKKNFRDAALEMIG